MQGITLHPSAMSSWMLLSSSCGINEYRPSGEEIFLKNENGLKYEDEIYIIPASAINLTLNWVGTSLLKAKLEVTIFLEFDEPSISTVVEWDFHNKTNPLCRIRCVDGREFYDPRGETRELLIERLVMLVKKFPGTLRGKILKPLKELAKSKQGLSMELS